MNEFYIKERKFNEAREWLNQNVGIGHQAESSEFFTEEYRWFWNHNKDVYILYGFTKVIYIQDSQDVVAFRLRFG